MAAPSSQLRAGGYFATLAGLLVILYLLVFFTGKSPKPELGLDLQGGTTVTLTAHTENGNAPKKTDLDVAQTIIENRVNGLGVANSNVVTQGNDQIVISVPGSNGAEAKSLGSTAQLYFRATLAGPLAVNQTARPTTTPTNSGTPSANSGTPSASTTPTTPSSSAGPSSSTSSGELQPSNTASNNSAPLPHAVLGPDGSTRSTGQPGTVHGQPAAYTVAAPAKTTPTPAPSPSASVPDTSQLPAGVTPALANQLTKSCAALSKAAALPAAKDQKVVVCTSDGKSKYIMDKPLIKGTEVKGASAVYNSDPTSGQAGWSISLQLKGAGQKVWTDYTSKHNVTVTPGSLANKVGFVLDGQLLGDPPEIQGTIAGDTSISGSYDAKSAQTLANNFKYGALPLNFTTSNAQTISATLGTSQLKAGLLAGGIGLALVVVYSLLYYRVLGLVTIASLVISGLLVYACVVLLGRQLGFTLTLAGIAGFIVAVGITADSFVVFFERLKEEVHGGRSMRSGVPRAWVRARRTILSADAVSFLAAFILYYLAAGDVKGFAFTLGLSTILDLVVVFLFTHPIVSVASRNKAFASPRISGLGSLRPAAAGGPSDTSSSSAAERAAARRDRVAKES